jgi:hypothetical protein
LEQQQQRHIAVRSDDESEDESEPSMGSSTKRQRETQDDPVFGRAERPKLSHHSLLIAAAALEQQSAGDGGGGEEEEEEEGFFLQQKSPRLQLDKNSEDLKLGQQQRHSTSPPEDESSRPLFSEEERQQHKPSSAAADIQVAAEGSKISITAAAAAKDPFQLTLDQKVKLLLHVCACTRTPKLQENTRNRRKKD